MAQNDKVHYTNDDILVVMECLPNEVIAISHLGCNAFKCELSSRIATICLVLMSNVLREIVVSANDEKAHQLINECRQQLKEYVSMSAKAYLSSETFHDNEPSEAL